jgi:DNA polymerase I-like protein with 3'-5' exonuclease and polymerase domains
MKYIVFDTETTIRNRGDEAVGDNQGSPYHHANRAWLFGWKSDQCKRVNVVRHKDGFDKAWFRDASWLVGQNIRFDLAYLRKHYPIEYELWLQGGGRIWDTQTVEYLITSQQTKMVSLDKLAEKYGGTLKDDRVKEYWQAGIDTPDIPDEVLVPYLEQDVLNTEKVFLAQAKQVRELGMTKLVLSQMDAMLATAEMQWNGMRFDKEKALAEASILRDTAAGLRAKLTEAMTVYHPHIQDPNPMSNEQISLVLFGGVVFIDEQLPVLENGEPVRYKSGARKDEIKTKKQAVPYGAAGFGIKTKEENATTKKGIYQVGDNILNDIIKAHKGKPVAEFCMDVLQLRAIEKDLTTYFIGLSDLTWHDGYIRGEHNHCVTVTGRLSSSKPNMMNISNKVRENA